MIFLFFFSWFSKLTPAFFSFGPQSPHFGNWVSFIRIVKSRASSLSSSQGVEPVGQALESRWNHAGSFPWPRFSTGLGIDVPTIGDWFHITKRAISVGIDIPFLVWWCDCHWGINPNIYQPLDSRLVSLPQSKHGWKIPHLMFVDFPSGPPMERDPFYEKPGGLSIGESYFLFFIRLNFAWNISRACKISLEDQCIA